MSGLKILGTMCSGLSIGLTLVVILTGSIHPEATQSLGMGAIALAIASLRYK